MQSTASLRMTCTRLSWSSTRRRGLGRHHPWRRKAFCAGADIKQRFVAMTPQESARRERGPNPEGYLGRTINWKPVIAAVHGYALGAGIVIAAESDMIVASEDAKFGITESRRGLAGGRIWAKVNAFMPSKIASEMVITGEPVEAAELYRLGLINRLVPNGFHLSAAEGLAEKVLKTPPLSARVGVKLTRRQWVQAGAEADMQTLPLKLHMSEDFKEASQAFVEKASSGVQSKVGTQDSPPLRGRTGTSGRSGERRMRQPSASACCTPYTDLPMTIPLSRCTTAFRLRKNRKLRRSICMLSTCRDNSGSVSNSTPFSRWDS